MAARSLRRPPDVNRNRRLVSTGTLFSSVSVNFSNAVWSAVDDRQDQSARMVGWVRTPITGDDAGIGSNHVVRFRAMAPPNSRSQIGTRIWTTGLTTSGCARKNRAALRIDS